MTDLLAQLGISTTSLAVLFAGIAAFLGVIAWTPAGGVRHTVKSRFDQVQKRREAMRDVRRIADSKKKKGQIDEGTLRMMRNTIEKFQMQELLDNTELRMKLARAGYRGQKAPIIYLFLTIVAPILVAIGVFVYFFVFYQGEFQIVRHGGMAVLAAAAGYKLPDVMITNKTQKRQQLMQRAFPDALDLSVICVESGMSVENAFGKVSVEIAEQSKDLAEEIALTNAELSYIGDRGLAYENFARRTGMQAVKALTGALIQAERYGTPVAAALRVLSEESRGERMSIAERKAAALPAKLTVPMIVFFLPVLFVVIIGPAAIQIMDRF